MKQELVKGHQGDVQFQQITALPKNARKIENKPIALGEHSGHMHILTGPVDMFEHEGKIFTVVGGDGARLQHIHESKLTPAAWITTKEIEKADHHSHLLPPGTYEFFIQNSFNPYSKLMEQVED